MCAQNEKFKTGNMLPMSVTQTQLNKLVFQSRAADFSLLPFVLNHISSRANESQKQALEQTLLACVAQNRLQEMQQIFSHSIWQELKKDKKLQKQIWITAVLKEATESMQYFCDTNLNDYHIRQLPLLLDYAFFNGDICAKSLEFLLTQTKCFNQPYIEKLEQKIKNKLSATPNAKLLNFYETFKILKDRHNLSQLKNECLPKNNKKTKI